MTDNAKCYGSKAFTTLCRTRGVRQCFTRPYTPRTNGKAERFIQTLVRRWAYRRPYRSSALRTAALRPWIRYYNHQRPHRSLGMIPPIQRLRAAR
jgi:transposase InsO family protein